MLATARAECRAQVDSPDVCTHVRQTPHLRTHPVPTSFRLPQTAAHMNEPRRKTASEISMSPLRIHACKCTPFFRQKERNAEQKYQQIIHLTLFPAPRSAPPGKTGEKSALRHILQRSHRPMARGRKQKKRRVGDSPFCRRTTVRGLYRVFMASYLPRTLSAGLTAGWLVPCCAALRPSLEHPPGASLRPAGASPPHGGGVHKLFIKQTK